MVSRRIPARFDKIEKTCVEKALPSGLNNPYKVVILAEENRRMDIMDAMLRLVPTILLCAISSYGQVSVLTYHNDLYRTGQNLNETSLTPSTLLSRQFGQLFAEAVDGQVYAQPLYVPGLNIPGKGVYNAVFVVTEPPVKATSMRVPAFEAMAWARKTTAKRRARVLE